jgi:hypothetical protein
MPRTIATLALLSASACATATTASGDGAKPEAPTAEVPKADPPKAADQPPPSAGAGAPSAGAPSSPAAASSPPPADEPASPPPNAAGAALPPIPPGTVVVHIGDSFALAGFAKALKKRMKALGARYDVRAETSSFTTTWSGKIENVIANTQPDLVIINLGANEVANIDPPAHAPAVRHIVAAIKGRPCVWVSPPSWRKDTGIQDVIRQNSAPCRYFDSDKLVTEPIPRQKDHIHPTDEGGAIWADAFWSWLQAERAPLDPAEASQTPRPSPWRLKPSTKEEHEPRSP